MQYLSSLKCLFGGIKIHDKNFKKGIYENFLFGFIVLEMLSTIITKILEQ